MRAERAFCERYAARIERLALRRLRQRELARDVTQDVLLIALEAMRAGRIDAPEKLGSFVLSTCRHRVWDENRAETRRRRLLEVESQPALVLPDLASLDRDALEACLQTLSARDTAVVLYSYVEQWSASELAKKLELTPGNLRVIRHRALGQLQTCLDEKGAA